MTSYGHVPAPRALPAADIAPYLEPCYQQGTIVAERYVTRDYAAAGPARIEQTAYVYLPFGYGSDPKARYDVLYLMHGLAMTAESLFFQADSHLKDLMDNMVAAGRIAPTIVVTPTYAASDQPQGFDESVRQMRLFYEVFRNDLMPRIEGTFRTYAASPQPVDLILSRAHRAFGGFSLGAVATWGEFEHNLDFIKYFLPMSGDSWALGVYGGSYLPEETASTLGRIAASGRWGDDGFLVYAATGTEDPLGQQLDDQMQALLACPAFPRGSLVYALLEGGRHDLAACEQYLFDALPLFFPFAG